MTTRTTGYAVRLRADGTAGRGGRSPRTRAENGIPHLWQGLRRPVRPQLHHHHEE
ncbi:hypothetical protein [Ornithinimicrobium pekingense]|uniref:hypothetical protein n=1 Tax=Ornithinimicrobium pekingense TaxID=384677 RepID=UPI000400FCF3|nr:hypothetical protein [Ornithinimicrobium pekingense]